MGDGRGVLTLFVGCRRRTRQVGGIAMTDAMSDLSERVQTRVNMTDILSQQADSPTLAKSS